MATKKHIELENAEDFYKKVQACDGKLDEIKEKMAELKKDSAEPDKEDIVQEALKNLEELYDGEKEMAEHNIKVALGNYLLYYEKEKKTLTKQRDNYEKYVKEEQAKLETLKAEIEALEGDEEQKDVLEDKKADYEDLKIKVEAKLKKLEGFDERIANLDNEMQQAKEKFKGYMELAAIENAEQEKEETNSDKDKSEEEKTEPKEQSEHKNETPEKDENKEKTDVESNNKGQQTVSYIANGSLDEQYTEEQPETDEQAFNRIYKLLSKRKTRDSVTNEDIDKMIDILSNKENYSKLNIGTRRFLDLGIFPSKAEKIYKQLGKKLSYDVYKVTKNNDVLSIENRAELAKWENINELGVKIDEKTEAEIALDNALLAASDADKEQIVTVKNRIEKYRQSMVTLDEVMFDRGELRFVNKELPEGKDEVVEYKDMEVKEAEVKGIFADLEGAVKSEVTEPTSKEIIEAPSKTEKIMSDGHDAI